MAGMGVHAVGPLGPPRTGDGCSVTYIWLGASDLSMGGDLRALTRLLHFVPNSHEQVPVTACDGSWSNQASREFSSLYLQPRSMFQDPFKGAPHVCVLCEVCKVDPVEGLRLRPHDTDNRPPCAAVMNRAIAAGVDPTFLIQQEYTLCDPDSRLPVASGHAKPGSWTAYCGVGYRSVIGRKFAEDHVDKCRLAGLKVGSVHQLGSPGQWAYTLGPCLGVRAGDELQMSRYILHRLSEDHRFVVSLDPNPCPERCGTLGAPVKYSTWETRCRVRGPAVVADHIANLEAAHLHHLMFYGSNGWRMGAPGVARFSAGVENRDASIRIPFLVAPTAGGYYEDRRPASNMDPYLVTMMLVCTTQRINLPVEVGVPSQSQSSSVPISRGSVSLIESMLEYDSFDSHESEGAMGPNTPPQISRGILHHDQEEAEDSVSDNHAILDVRLPPVNMQGRRAMKH